MATIYDNSLIGIIQLGIIYPPKLPNGMRIIAMLYM